jgi:hypothetical protein
MTKVYEVTLRIVDLDGLGGSEICDVLENTRYANHCISPKVSHIRTADAGEWSDDHPLNHRSSFDAEWNRLFPKA